MRESPCRIVERPPRDGIELNITYMQQVTKIGI